MIRIGLLGASRVSGYAVIEPAAGVEGVEVSAVAARDVSRARIFAEANGIPNVAADYDALVTSDAVDLVYNGLPPAGHARWSIAALEAGKHVLCEKPFALNAEEARAMVEKVAKETWIPKGEIETVARRPGFEGCASVFSLRQVCDRAVV